VTINQADHQTDPTGNSTINFTVVFSEPVAGLSADSLTITKTAGTLTATTTPVGSDGTTYNVAVSGMSQTAR